MSLDQTAGHAALAAGSAATDPLAYVSGRRTSVRVSGDVVARLHKAFDACVIAACGLVSLIASTPPLDRFALLRIIAALLFVTFAALLAVRVAGGYDIRRMIYAERSVASTLTGTFLAAIASLAVLALVGVAGPLSLIVPVTHWWGAVFMVLSVERAAVARTLRHYDDAGRLSRRIAVVGGGNVAREVIAKLTGAGDANIDLCGFFDDRGEDRTPTAITGAPHLGTVDDLIEFSRWFRIDMIIVALPLAADRRLFELLKRLWVIPADIRISALGSPLRLSPRTYTYLDQVPLLEAFDRPLDSWAALVKDLFDRVVAAGLLVVLAPVLAAVALAVRLDSPGPVLFRQPRYGFNNQLIEIFKFRSMNARDSDRHADRLVTRGDPRVTRVGRFIRRTSLDELPQLINVLRGELSLVGPRPHAVRARAAGSLYDDVVEGYLARHRVKPGVTGWAQINGWRGETDTTEKIERRVEYDLYYISHWSLWFDIKIMLRTPFALLAGDNAY